MKLLFPTFCLRPLVLSTCVALGACGGGGGSPSEAPARPEPTQLSAAAGNLKLYTGVWRSDCGLTYPQGAVSSVINEYHFNEPAGKVVSATLMQYHYKDSYCRDAVPGAFGQPQARQAQVITIGDVVNVVPSTAGTSGSPFVGTADLVQIQAQGVSKRGYIAFSEAGQRMHMATELPFSNLSLTYRRP